MPYRPHFVDPERKPEGQLPALRELATGQCLHVCDAISGAGGGVGECTGCGGHVAWRGMGMRC